MLFWGRPLRKNAGMGMPTWPLRSNHLKWEVAWGLGHFREFLQKTFRREMRLDAYQQVISLEANPSKCLNSSSCVPWAQPSTHRAAYLWASVCSANLLVRLWLVEKSRVRAFFVFCISTNLTRALRKYWVLCLANWSRVTCIGYKNKIKGKIGCLLKVTGNVKTPETDEIVKSCGWGF